MTTCARLALLAVALLAIGCHLPDKVAVIELTASEPAPTPGTLVTVRAKVSNTSEDRLARVMVDVDIPNRAPIATLYRDFVDLAPGATAELTTSYVANVGMNVVTACIDPTNSLGETPAGRENNCRRLDLTRYALQELDYQRAGRSGATFSDAPETPGTCARLGQSDSSRSTAYGTGRAGVVFIADCPTYGSAFLIPVGTGGKANPTVFSGFTLANGWTVDSVTLSFRANREDTTDVHPTLAEAQGSSRPAEGFSFTAPATAGSATPAMTAHIWSEPGAFLVVHARVVIKGPEGTDPYGPGTTPCFSGWDEDQAVVYVCNVNADCVSPYTCRTGCCLRD